MEQSSTKLFVGRITENNENNENKTIKKIRRKTANKGNTNACTRLSCLCCVVMPNWFQEYFIIFIKRHDMSAIPCSPFATIYCRNTSRRVVDTVNVGKKKLVFKWPEMDERHQLLLLMFFFHFHLKRFGSGSLKQTPSNDAWQLDAETLLKLLRFERLPKRTSRDSCGLCGKTTAWCE